MLKEFRDFINQGNVMDLAVAVIIGGAFGKIVSSLVSDIVMPLVGSVLGKVDFANLFVALDGKTYATLQAAKDAGAPTLNYGLFVNAVIDFLIIAFVIFLIVRQVNAMKKPAPAAAPMTKDCPRCATSIPLKAARCPHCTSELTAA
jgi:large conductance mechanosensitive channel